MRVEFYLAVDRRKKLEAPPAYRVEMPTYWKASLEPINPEELGRYQFHRLVQDAAGTIFVAHQPSEDQAAIWLLCIRDVWIEMMGRMVSLLDQNKSQMLSRAMRHVPGWYYAERQSTDRWGRQRVFRRNGVDAFDLD